MKCRMCNKKARSKGLCHNHYMQQRYKDNPELRKQRQEYAKKYWQIYKCKKMIQDPDYAKRKNKEYRQKHPERFAYASAKHYMKKLSPELREKLLYELKQI